MIIALRKPQAPVGRPSDKQLFDQALRELASAGIGSEVAISRIAMEVALLANAAGLPVSGSLVSAEWLAARVAASGLRDVGRKTHRRRLMGMFTRIYPVAANWRSSMSAVSGDDDPLNFCRESVCCDCRYASHRVHPVLLTAALRSVECISAGWRLRNDHIPSIE